MNNEEEVEELFGQEIDDNVSLEENPLYIKDKLRNQEKLDFQRKTKIPTKDSNGIPQNASLGNSNNISLNNLSNNSNGVPQNNDQINENQKLGNLGKNNKSLNNELKNNKYLNNNVKNKNSTSKNFQKSKLPNKNIIENRNLKKSNDVNRLNQIRNQKLNTYNNLQSSIMNAKSQKENSDQSNLKQKAKKGALTALGVPSSLADSISKKSSDDISLLSPVVNISGNMKLIFGSLAILFIIIIIVILAIIGVTSEDDDSELNSQPEIVGYISGGTSENDFVNALVYMNLCSSSEDDNEKMEDCLNSPAGKYFKHLKDLYSSYLNYKDINGESIKLNIPIILETISYDVTDMELFDEDNLENILSKADELAAAQVELYQEYGDLYKLNGKKCIETKDKIVTGNNKTGSYYRISMDKYTSYLLYGSIHENYKNQIRKIDVDIHPDSNSSCIPNGRTYKSSNLEQTETTYSGDVKNGYIYTNIVIDYNLNESKVNDAIQTAIKTIFERANQLSDITISSNYGLNCSGVIVTGNNEGVYSLEDYVAGVVQNENNWYEGNNIENMKAQAVAARTYVLRVTNDCTFPIENSTSKQTMNPNYSEQAKRAAVETSGQVLLDASGKYLSTEYDALAVKEVTSDYYVIQQAGLKIPTSWINSHISAKNLEYYANHHHGRGMSQWGSRYLQTKGYNYEQILSTFYTNGQLTTLGSATIGDIPNSVEDLKNRYYFNFDIENYKSGNGFGQCVWYAKHRAMEILASSNLEENSKQILINSIKQTVGNGIDWYRTPNSTYFKKSTNINDARAGAIVSWAWNNANKIASYGANYGHVAIVESVYKNANGQTMVTITEGWRSRCSSGVWCQTNDLWSVVNIRKKELTLSQLQTYSGSFNGYVYLLG